MRIIFMGTPDFSAVVLEKLNKHHKVIAVVTGLDKPVGRGYNLLPSPLKIMALKLGIQVLQFNKVSKDGIDEIKNLKPDVVVTAAFGQILSDEFLNIPKFGVLNVHASLLPKYRGASPIQWSILNGDDSTGITIMKTVKEIDAGDILLQKKLDINSTFTAGTLFDELSYLGGESIVEAIDLLKLGNATFTQQNNNEATHCGMIKKTDGKLDFSKTYNEIDCWVRGMNPWPSAFTMIEDKLLKVYDVENASNLLITKLYRDGEIIYADNKNGLIVSCKEGAVRLKNIQLQGSKQMEDKVFLNGRTFEIGTIL